MPGRSLCNGALNHRQDAAARGDAAALALHGDMGMMEYQWDFLNPPTVHFPVPFAPGKHKACWPAQSHKTRLQKMKEDKHAKFLSSGPFNETKYSNESEHDLAAMVHEYVENGSCDMCVITDPDNGASTIAQFCENLQILTTPSEPLHRELLAKVTKLVLDINEDTDLIHSSVASECKGSCARRFVVKHLKAAGYNAGFCKSRWRNSGRVPGGEYDYLDVILVGDRVPEERLIVDIDFQAQFEIARPTPHYLAALKTLPAIFVGTKQKLEQVLDMMSEAAKTSLKQNSMHLPPWRTLDYMSAKWLSHCERHVPPSEPLFSCSVHRRGMQQQQQAAAKPVVCEEQLRRTRVSLLSDVKGSGLQQLGLGAVASPGRVQQQQQQQATQRAILKPINKRNW